MESPQPVWVPGMFGPDDATSLARVEVAAYEDRLAADSSGAPAIAGGDPFITLYDGGRFARVLLARIAIGSGDTVVQCALKLAKDRLRPVGTTGLAAASICNAEIDAMWERERAALVAVAGAEDGTAAQDGVPVVRAFSLGRVECPPTFFCRATRAFATARCPETGETLRLCRDDEVLRRFGLEPYSTTTERYLFCEQQIADQPTAARFYTLSQDSGRDAEAGVVVSRGREVFEVVAQAADLDQASLVSVAFYGATPSLLEILPLQFDELMDWIGGADHDALVRMHPSFGGGARAVLTEPLRGVLDSRPGYTFDLERDRRFAREVLLLKLQAFAEVCRGVAVHHERTGRPHLAIDPSNVLAMVGPELRVGVRSRQIARVRLSDLGAVHRFVHPGPEGADLPPIYLPSLDVNTTFRSSLVESRGFGREVSMQLTARAQDEAADDPRVVLDGRALGQRLDGWQVGDVVRLVPHSAIAGVGVAGLVGVVVEVARTDVAIELRLGADQAFDPAVAGAFEAVVAFYRRHQSPCDLFGLGMLLLRGLLVNDQQDVFTVEDATRRVLDQLALEYAEAASSGRTANLETRLVALWRGGGAVRVFDGRALLFAQADRDALSEPLPDATWHRVLKLAFRMLSTLPGIGICTHHGDVPVSEDGVEISPARPVLAALEQLVAELRIELFGADVRDAEIGQACRDLMAELGPALLGGAQGGDS